MPYLIKGLLEIYEDMIQALLMLKVFLAKDSKVFNGSDKLGANVVLPHGCP